MVTRVTAPPTKTIRARKTSPRAGKPADKAATEAAAKTPAKTVARRVKKNVSRAVTGTLGLSGERMSKVDTAWLRMDSQAT